MTSNSTLVKMRGIDEEAVRIYNENVEKVHGEFGITQEVL